MSMSRVMLSVAAVGVALLVALTWGMVAEEGEAPRIGLDELKAKLESSNLLIVDVRAAKDWAASDIKIKRAIREDPREIGSWISKYPKDKTIVFYCA